MLDEAPCIYETRLFGRVPGLGATIRIYARNVLTKTYLNGTIVNLTTEHHKSRFKRRRRRRRAGERH